MEWLAEEIGFLCGKAKKIKIEDIQKYDVVILGGGIYASRIAGISFLKKNPDEYEIWERVLMAAGDEDCDWADRKYLRSILGTIQYK